MKLPPVLLALVAASKVRACMEFNGIFPFSHTLPFEASIVENGVTTCWISTTLNEHNALQTELFSHQQSHKSKSKTKRSVGRKISLTDRPAYDPSLNSPTYKSLPGPATSAQFPIEEHRVDLTTIPPPRNGQLLQTQKMEEPEWDDIPVWQPWNFECISGYKARANVGMRGFTYVAHGQDFFFVPKMKEDVWGGRWVYSLKLWCGEKDKKGNVVERPKPKGEAKSAGASSEGIGGGKKESGKGNVVERPKPKGEVKSAGASSEGSGGGKKESGKGKSSTTGGSAAKNGLKG